MLVLLTLIVSCASVPKQENKVAHHVKKENSRIYFNAGISVEFPDFNQSISSNVKLMDNDSLTLTALGPFGVAVGRLYADRNEFVFYNIFENQVFLGKPTRDNLYKAMRMSLSYDDLFAVFRSETPVDINDYKVFKDSDQDIIYFRKIDEQFAEFIVVDKAANTMKQIQRKSAGDETEMNVFFDKYEMMGDELFAKKIIIDFPKLDGKLEININNLKVIKDLEQFKFSYPKSAKIIRFD